MLSNFLKMLLGNYQIVVYLVVALISSGLIYKGYSIIKQNATNKIVIEQLQQINKGQQKTISNLQIEKVLSQHTVQKRDDLILKLSEQLDNLTVDLGLSSVDAVSPSIQKYLKNLKDQIK